MADVVGFGLELMSSTVLLFLSPLSLAKLLFLLGFRAFALALLMWLHLVKAIVNFHVDLCWRVLVLAIFFVSLPVRFLTALHREHALEMQLHDVRVQLESLVWENKELEERLQMAIKDRKVIEMTLEEVEEEHEKAFARIDHLETELQVLKAENLRFNEVQGKSLWDYKSCEEKDRNAHDGIPLGSNHGGSSWSSSNEGSGLTLRDILRHADPWTDVDKHKLQHQDILKIATSYPFSAHMAPGILAVDEALEKRRVVALYRSLFSAFLSLLVGMIIWGAEDPCIPLVTALFIVVGMSLSSVVQFFSTIKNKPASDAVALLSVNWFILGTLTSPSLPSVARALVPQTVLLTDQLVRWFGFSSFHDG